MKKFYFIPAAAMALALAACSSDDVLAPEGNGPQWNAEGKGYVSLAINLPKEKATLNRAPNDVFDDGTPEEYDVKNAVLLVFAGTDEANATLQGAYNLTLPTFGGVDDDPNQITSTVQLTQAINQVNGTNAYALVALNTGGVMTVDQSNTLTFVGESAAFTGTFQNFQAKTMTMANGDVTSIAGSANGFFMTNAPLASAVGAADFQGTVSTLTSLNNQIYSTEAEAASNPAAEVYVERAVAKVEVTATTNKGTLPTVGNLAWTINGWALDKTNTTSYVTRNANTASDWWEYQNGSNGFRFIGTSEVATGAGFRTYWATDPNYADVQTGLHTLAARPSDSEFATVGSVKYCLENTFDVAHMNKDLTTTVYVKATIGDGRDFFTLGNTRTTTYTKATLDEHAKAAFIADPAVTAALTANLQANQTFTNDDIEAVTYSTDQAGTWTVTGVTYADGAAAKFDGGVIPTELQEGGAAYQAGVQNATDLRIECYKGGVSYYPVLIKHFGDDLTPWSQTGSDSYPAPDAENNWLGRYGVLRNNWYKVNVTGISNLGDPIIEEVTGPDDPTQAYISVEINVLSWAVRTQNVEL